MIYKEIIVHPNIRIQTYLENYLLELTAELKRLEKSNDVLGNITHLVELISKMTPSYKMLCRTNDRAFHSTMIDQFIELNELLALSYESLDKNLR